MYTSHSQTYNQYTQIKLKLKKELSHSSHHGVNAHSYSKGNGRKHLQQYTKEEIQITDVWKSDSPHWK